LRETGRSAAQTRKVLTSLSSIVADAQERGLATRNPLRERKRRSKATKRNRKQLKVGIDIPTPIEVRAILAASEGRWRAFCATAALAGLRLSELRGLPWRDVDFAAATVNVSQRADAWGDLGNPKAMASRRTIPVPPLVVNALREWKLACPKGELRLVFPNEKGGVLSHGRGVIRDAWHEIQIAAGISVPVTVKNGKPVLDDGEPVMRAKYGGLHCLRHFFASWCAARPQDGGLGLPLKTVQTRLGHGTLAMTSDTYGHLFPSQDDAEVLAAGERALMGA
jgi:integrase